VESHSDRGKSVQTVMMVALRLGISEISFCLFDVALFVQKRHTWFTLYPFLLPFYWANNLVSRL
jgi:hypothetical protein